MVLVVIWTVELPLAATRAARPKAMVAVEYFMVAIDYVVELTDGWSKGIRR